MNGEGEAAKRGCTQGNKTLHRNGATNLRFERRRNCHGQEGAHRFLVGNHGFTSFH